MAKRKAPKRKRPVRLRVPAELIVKADAVHVVIPSVPKSAFRRLMDYLS